MSEAVGRRFRNRGADDAASPERQAASGGTVLEIDQGAAGGHQQDQADQTQDEGQTVEHPGFALPRTEHLPGADGHQDGAEQCQPAKQGVAQIRQPGAERAGEIAITLAATCTGPTGVGGVIGRHGEQQIGGDQHPAEEGPFAPHQRDSPAQRFRSGRLLAL